MAEPDDRVLEACGKRTQSTFHPRPVIYTILPRNGQYPRIPEAWMAADVPSAGHRSHLGRSNSPASGCLYTLRPLQGATRQSGDFQEFDGGLSVGVAGSPAVDGPAALAPARRGGSEDLDTGDHSIAQFHPEFLQQAQAEEPQLRGPCR